MKQRLPISGPSRVIVSAVILVVCFALFPNYVLGMLAWFENALRNDPPVPKGNEVVMPPNSVIQATTSTGRVIIRSGDGLRRSYTWEGATRSVVMIPRASRWYGSLGLYYPGTGRHWIPKHNGISRGVLEEGQQNFDSSEQALEWIEEIGGSGPIVYRDDGLLVLFGKTLPREQLDVEVWQIYIKGQKPTKLAGSKNSAIRVSRAH